MKKIWNQTKKHSVLFISYLDFFSTTSAKSVSQIRNMNLHVRKFISIHKLSKFFYKNGRVKSIPSPHQNLPSNWVLTRNNQCSLNLNSKIQRSLNLNSEIQRFLNLNSESCSNCTICRSGCFKTNKEYSNFQVEFARTFPAQFL